MYEMMQLSFLKPKSIQALKMLFLRELFIPLNFLIILPHNQNIVFR